MSNFEPLISVIIPVYNVEKYLQRCIESIINQTYKKLEIILIDDGSFDESGKLCDELSLRDSRIKIIHKKNGGLASARNSGLDICKGDYISFIDSDDFIEKEMFEELLNANINNKTMIACGGRFDSFENNNKKSIGLCPLKNEVIDSKEGIRRILTWDNVDSSACDKLFHKHIWDTLRFPVGKISEDVAVMYLAFEQATTISMVAKPYYNYFHRLGSITTSSFKEKKFDIIYNVEKIEEFIKNNYVDLYEDYLYFKAVEYHYIIGSLIKTNAQYKDVEKKLIFALRECRKIFKRFKGKTKISYYIYSSITLYNICKFFYKMGRK